MVVSFVNCFGVRKKTATARSQGRSYFTNQNQLLHEKSFLKIRSARREGLSKDLQIMLFIG